MDGLGRWSWLDQEGRTCALQPRSEDPPAMFAGENRYLWICFFLEDLEPVRRV
jgi:hypothetical protein